MMIEYNLRVYNKVIENRSKEEFTLDLEYGEIEKLTIS